MKILITGSTGMVGKNLIADLTNSPLTKSFKLLTPSRQELNLFNYSDVYNYMCAQRPDLVIHCASRVGGIMANMASPADFLFENLDINKNVIYAAYKANIYRLINLGSSCMYPRDAKNPLTEDLILTGELEPTNEGYAIAKIAAQRLCSYIQKENNQFKYKTLIPCNLYGPHDKFDPQKSHLVPAVIRKIYDAVQNNSKTVEIWGDGHARREFMSCADLNSCIIKCIHEYDTVPDVMNVGLGYDYSIREYYEAISEVIGFKGQFVYDLTKPVGMKQKLVSIEKLKMWGWQSQTPLKSGLMQTYQYFLKLVANERSR
jgi:GDP-L-fucose synthase